MLVREVNTHAVDGNGVCALHSGNAAMEITGNGASVDS